MSVSLDLVLRLEHLIGGWLTVFETSQNPDQRKSNNPFEVVSFPSLRISLHIAAESITAVPPLATGVKTGVEDLSSLPRL